MIGAQLVDGRLVLPAARVQSGRGRMAVAGFDEDTVTLAAAAAAQILEAQPGARPRALLLASLTSPYAEGGSVQILVEALGMTDHALFTLEVTGTLAAGIEAVVTAMALVEAGLGPVLVVAADCGRLAASSRRSGDGAVAVLLDAQGGAARMEYRASSATEQRILWRAPGELTVRRADASLLPLLAVPSPGDGHGELRDAAGASIDRVGAPGCVTPLARALLELASPDGATGALTAVANGVAHSLGVSPGADAAQVSARAERARAGGHDTAREPSVPQQDFEPFTSQPRNWRERGQDLGLIGVRCRVCDEVYYPSPPTCPVDGPRGELVGHRLARTGTVFTFTRDHVFPYGAPVLMAVVALDGGGRFYGQMSDAQEARIGDRVTLVLRALYTVDGLRQYFWKAVPAPEVDGRAEVEPKAMTSASERV